MTYDPRIRPLDQAYFGVRIIESDVLPAGDMLRTPEGIIVGIRGPANEHELTVLEERHAARMTVRRGLADVLEWLGMDAELPLMADGALPLRGQVRRPALKIKGPDGWQTVTPARWEWPAYPEQHPCGHFTVRPGCGGCDPGAIEYVLDDAGQVVWRADSAGTPARPEYAFDEEW